MSAVLLAIQGLRKSFGTRLMLDIAALELEAGCSYALTGDNGTGKSTLLRIIAGLEPALIGAFRFDSKTADLNDYPGWLRREVIYVHQHPYLFHTGVRENIAYGLKARGIAKAQRAALVAEAIHWAGVSHLLTTPAHRLSGGEKQRVALARAKVLQPRLLLLDEPTANLDVAARKQTIELIADFCNSGCTVMIACHDRELIELPRMERLHLEGGMIVREPALASATASVVALTEKRPRI